MSNMGLLTEPNAELAEVPPDVEHPHGSCCSPSPLPLERTAFAEKPFATKRNFQRVKGEHESLLRFVRAKEDESSVLWDQRLFTLWVEELHNLPLLLLPTRARVVPCIWVVADLSAACTARQSLGRENEHWEDDRLAREGRSLQHRLKAFYFCFLLSFYLLFLMWLAGLPLFCGRGAEC